MKGKLHKKKVKKAMLKKMKGKMWKDLSMAMKKKKEEKRAAQAKQKAKDAKDAVPPAVSAEENAAWAGKTVRVISPTATTLWQNSKANVKKLVQPGIAEVWMEGAVTVKTECEVRWLYVVTSKEKPSLPPLDLRKMLGMEKRLALDAAGGEVHCILAGSQVEHPELSAAWEMLKARGRQVGDSTYNCVYVEPAVTEVLHHYSKSELAPNAVKNSEDLKKLLQGIGPTGNALVVVPVCAGGHWTVLFFSRSSTDTDSWQATYYDSLKSGSASCKEKAEFLMQLVGGLLKEVQTGTVPSALPEMTVRSVQTDGITCGFHVVARMEEAYCEYRGEGKTGCYKSVGEIRKQLNSFLNTLQIFRAQQEKAASAGKGPEPAAPGGKGAASSSAAAVPMGAPGPILVILEIKLCFLFTTKQRKRRKRARKREREGGWREFSSQAQTCSEMKKQSQDHIQAATLGGTFGCGKCRYSVSGCLMCNPVKAAKHFGGPPKSMPILD